VRVGIVEWTATTIMAAEMGRRLLAEVQEVGLDEVSRIPHNNLTI
jgi:hypothetical protein